MSNIEKFRETLARHYADLFKNDPKYAFAAARNTPEALALKMTDGLVSGSANKDGEGIKRTVRELKIKNTYAAIRAYLSEADRVPAAAFMERPETEE